MIISTEGKRKHFLDIEAYQRKQCANATGNNLSEWSKITHVYVEKKQSNDPG